MKPELPRDVVAVRRSIWSRAVKYRVGAGLHRVTALRTWCGCLLLILPFATAALDAPVCSRLDFARRIGPLQELTAHAPEPTFGEARDPDWVELLRWRVDTPDSPPPLVPAGLAGLSWAFENPSDGWRVVLPIPPNQVPRLVLPADPCDSPS